jgi:hypothetical protein
MNKPGIKIIESPQGLYLFSGCGRLFLQSMKKNEAKQTR